MKKHKKAKNVNDYYEVMFCPEGRGHLFSLRLHRYALYVMLISVALVVAGVAALLYNATDIALKLQHVNVLTEENNRLREYNRNLEISAEKIANIDSMTAYLRRIAGIAGLADIRVDATPAAPVTTTPAAVTPAASVTTTAVPVTPTGTVETPAQVAVAAPAAPVDFAMSVPNIMPVNGWITRRFEETLSGGAAGAAHRGIDIAATFGTPIRATAFGVVEDVRVDRYLGLLVEVRHDHGFLTRFGHASQALVSIGDRVSRGQTVALVGSTGRSTAPHVHYEVLRNGRYIDPMTLIAVQE